MYRDHMKKISFLLLGVMLCSSTVESMSFAKRTGNFLLESFDRGFNGKKSLFFVLACSSVYTTFFDEELELKRRIPRLVGVIFAAAGACGFVDAMRVRIWPNSPDVVAEREAEQKLKEKIAQCAADLEQSKKEHAIRMEEIDTRHRAIVAEVHKNRVRRAFYKALADGLPQSCVKIAEEFRKLWGEQEYQKELNAFHGLREMCGIQRVRQTA